MGLNKILDKKYNKQTTHKSEKIECMKNISDCMFLTKNNMCSAEWCIFEELPKMIYTEKEIKCTICNKSKTVSVYSGKTEYICSDCVNKLNELFKEK